MDKYHTIWMQGFADELGKLKKGIWDITGTDTINLILLSAVPKGHTVTYGRICITYWPHNKYPNRTILTFCANHIHYPWNFSTTTSDLSKSKILFKSIIYTPGAILITMDIKNIPWHLHETFVINETNHQHPNTRNYQPVQIEIIRIRWLWIL